MLLISSSIVFCAIRLRSTHTYHGWIMWCLCKISEDYNTPASSSVIELNKLFCVQLNAKQCQVVYETGETEELQVDELIRDGIMSLGWLPAPGPARPDSAGQLSVAGVHCCFQALKMRMLHTCSVYSCRFSGPDDHHGISMRLYIAREYTLC